MFLFNLFDIFERARTHQALTPSERALLRAIDGFVILLFLVAVTALSPIIQSYTSGSTFDWSALIKASALAFFEVAGMTLMKLWKAQGDNGVIVQSGTPASVLGSPADPGVLAGDPGAVVSVSAASAVPSAPRSRGVGAPVDAQPAAAAGAGGQAVNDPAATLPVQSSVSRLAATAAAAAAAVTAPRPVVVPVLTTPTTPPPSPPMPYAGAYISSARPDPTALTQAGSPTAGPAAGGIFFPPYDPQ